MGLWDHSALPIPARLGARLKRGFPGRQAGLMSHLLAFGQVISRWVNQPLELGYSSTSARSWDVRAAWQELSSSAGMGTWLSGDLFVDCASDSSCPRPLCQGVTRCPRLPSSRRVPVFHRTLLLDLGGLALSETGSSSYPFTDEEIEDGGEKWLSRWDCFNSFCALSIISNDTDINNSHNWHLLICVLSRRQSLCHSHLTEGLSTLPRVTPFLVSK